VKPVTVLGSFVVIALVVTGAMGGQSDPTSDLQAGCPLSVVGTWKPDATPEANPILLGFSPEGWVSLLGVLPDTDPPSLEVIAQVTYKVLPPPTALRLEFRTNRGNDLIPQGVTSWEIATYDDGSFTARQPESGEQIRWVRLLTHRYFITFASVNGPGEYGGSAFAMWTTLDGRRITTEALGLEVTRDHQGNGAGMFGRVSEALAGRFATEMQPESDVMLRLELNEAEYQRSHRMFEAWEARTRGLATTGPDAYPRAAEFLESAAARLNQCGTRLDLEARADAAPANVAGDVDLNERPPRFVKVLRTLNDWRHVADEKFPLLWEPPPLN